jgi:RNA polymerase sigma-70 factor (ECF subfamily)
MDVIHHRPNDLAAVEQASSDDPISAFTAGKGDASLIAELISDDDTALEKFVLDHMPWMTAIAEHLLADPVLAEDCVQEAFFNTLRKIADFEEHSGLKSRLCHIVVIQALKKLQAMNNHSQTPFDDALPAPQQSHIDCRGSADQPTTHNQNRQLDDRCEFVITKFNDLPESYRLIIQFRDIDQRPTREAAELLRISEEVAELRLHKARIALYELLKPLLKG